MSDVAVTATGCLKVCDRGPALLVYPQNLWYGGIEGEDQIDAILDAMEVDAAAGEFLLE